MIEGLVKICIQRLNSLLVQSTETFSGFEVEIKWFIKELEKVGCFSQNIGGIEDDPAVCKWTNDVKDLVNDMDDRVDEFIIEMNDRDDESDQTVLVDRFKSELRKLKSCLEETIRKMGEFDNSTVDDEGETSTPSSLSYTTQLRYANLPYYLKYCLIYCCIFPEDDWISRGRLARLLTAENLIQEKQGKVMEETGEENIDELIKLGMLQQVDEYPNSGTKISVPTPYRYYLLHKMSEENFVVLCNDSNEPIPKSTRRLSLQTNMMSVTSKLENLRVRSFFLFANQELAQEESKWKYYNGAKYLRVLDLEGAMIKTLPDEVGDLIHLKYLGLKQNDITVLPERIGNLRLLQTLDIRRCGYLSETLPGGVLKLGQLRHLKMFKSDVICGMKVIKGLDGLKNLLTLTGVDPKGGTASELGELVQLRRLGVMDVNEEDKDELYSSIMKMEKLASLSIEAKHSLDHEELFVSETFLPPPFIKKLHLHGHLKKTPIWLGSMDMLTKLRLGYSYLHENPCLVLQRLPNLKYLTLWNAYEATIIGKEFCGVGGFVKLEYLCMASEVLEEWTEIDKGAFPILKHLHLHSCMKLRMLPEGLQFVSTLEQLDMLPLLDDHADRLKPDGGEEFYKIQNIPLVRFMTTSMINRLVHPEVEE